MQLSSGNSQTEQSSTNSKLQCMQGGKQTRRDLSIILCQLTKCDYSVALPGDPNLYARYLFRNVMIALVTGGCLSSSYGNNCLYGNDKTSVHGELNQIFLGNRLADCRSHGTEFGSRFYNPSSRSRHSSTCLMGRIDFTVYSR